MLVDTMTYVGNLYSECRRASSRASDAEKARFSLASSGLSLGVLFAITTWGLSDALQTLSARGVPKDDLDGGVVVAFGVFGVLFDLGAFYAFGKYGDAAPTAPGAHDGDAAAARAVERSAGDMNMWTALSHVGADSVRSFTSIVLGCVALTVKRANGTLCDAYGTLIVSCTILVSGFGLTAEWLKAIVAYHRAAEADKALETILTSARATSVSRAVAKSFGDAGDDANGRSGGAASDVELAPAPDPTSSIRETFADPGADGDTRSLV